MRYGRKVDTPDPRDYTKTYLYETAKVPVTSTTVPTSYNLRNLKDSSGKLLMVPSYDQGQLGSCTANAISFAYVFQQIEQNVKNKFMPSRLFLYYNERSIEGTVSSDSGAEIRDGIKSINKTGLCEEKLYPYDVRIFANKPPAKCYSEAKLAHTTKYARISQTTEQIKLSLLHNEPVVFGFQVYDSFESDQVASTGIVPDPLPGENCVGGHAVAIIGYDDNKVGTTGTPGMFNVRNSWGTSWGDQGTFWMSYKYVLDPTQCSDFWSVSLVTNPNLKAYDAHPSLSPVVICLDPTQDQVRNKSKKQSKKQSGEKCDPYVDPYVDPYGDPYVDPYGDPYSCDLSKLAYLEKQNDSHDHRLDEDNIED